MITKIMIYFNFDRKSAISEVAKKVIILTQRYVPIRVQKQKPPTLKKTFIFARIPNYTIIIVMAKKTKIQGVPLFLKKSSLIS